ncbi:MAG: hypothetical protein ACPGSM_08755 [Thiolinea sp.]
MKKVIISSLLIATSFTALQGCATKHYGRQGELTSFEKTTMTCRELDIEIAKVDGFVTKMNKDNKVDTRAVLAFLGDFGIGNTMERSAAMKSAMDRKSALNSVKEKKNCK